MNYLDAFTTLIQYKQKKQKPSNFKNIAFFSLLGVAIGGTAAALLVKNCKSKANKTIMNKTNNKEDVNKEDVNFKTDEIKKVLENEPDESLGDVGFAMEKALEDVETKNQIKDEPNKEE